MELPLPLKRLFCAIAKSLISSRTLKSERTPTTGRVSSRCPDWFAPHTPVNIADRHRFVTPSSKIFGKFVLVCHSSAAKPDVSSFSAHALFHNSVGATTFKPARNKVPNSDRVTSTKPKRACTKPNAVFCVSPQNRQAL